MILEIKKMKIKMSKNKGQVMMIVVMVLSGVIIGAATISGFLTASQTRQTADSGSSAVAIYAADAGLEWRMYKLYNDWKKDNLAPGNCSDCPSGVACDKKPSFVDNSEKINGVNVKADVVCVPQGDDGVYMYFKITSTGKAQNTSYSFQEVMKLAE
jgi:Tfp pilus assembly protein PilX